MRRQPAVVEGWRPTSASSSFNNENNMLMKRETMFGSHFTKGTGESMTTTISTLSPPPPPPPPQLTPLTPRLTPLPPQSASLPPLLPLPMALPMQPATEPEVFSMYPLLPSPHASLVSSSPATTSLEDETSELDFSQFLDDVDEMINLDLDQLASTVSDSPLVSIQPILSTKTSITPDKMPTTLSESKSLSGSSFLEPSGRASELALERDRRKIVRQRSQQRSSASTTLMEQGLMDNFSQVAASKIMEKIFNELIDEAMDTTNHVEGTALNMQQDKVANGMPPHMLLAALTQPNVESTPNPDLSASMSDAVWTDGGGLQGGDSIPETSSEWDCHQTPSPTRSFTRRSKGDLSISSKEEMPPKKQVRSKSSKSSLPIDASSLESAKIASLSVSRSRKPRKQYWERRRRDKFGFLITSLQRKIYHCNCYDCQAKREESKPPIEVETINVPDIWADLEPRVRAERPRGRGRPRKFPRLEELLRHQLGGGSENKAPSHQQEADLNNQLVTNQELPTKQPLTC